MSTVKKRVGEARRRLGRNLVLDSLLKAGFRASAAFAVAIVIHRACSPGFDAVWMAPVLGALAIGAACFPAFRRFPSSAAAAVEADRALRLKEQLSSALLLESGRGDDFRPNPVEEAFRLRAEEVAAGLDLRGAFPFRAPLEGKALPVAACAAVLLFFTVPELDLLGLLARKHAREENRRQVSDAADDLARRTRRLGERAQGLDQEAARQIVGDMEQVSRMLQRTEVDRKEALAELSELTRKIREMRKDAEKADPRAAFRPAADPGEPSEDAELSQAVRQAFREGGAREAAGELMKQLRSLKDEFSAGGLKAEDLARKSRQLEQLTRRFQLPPELAKKAGDLSRALKSLSERERKSYDVPPPDLQFTEEELAQFLKNLETRDFLEAAEKEAEAARRQMVQNVKLCPYCQKGLKHPDEGGTPIPGHNPEAEPGTAYI